MVTMKVLSAIVVIAFVVCGVSSQSFSQQDQRYIESYRYLNRHENQRELHRPESRQQYYYIQQSQQNVNDNVQHRHQSQNNQESLRNYNDYNPVSRYNNQQNMRAPEYQQDPNRKVIYQAVPYPVPVPDNQYHHAQKQADDPAFEIQQAIPIYMARQIYQLSQGGAWKLISEEEIRNPGPDANFNQRLLPPLFVQYPAVTVNHHRH
ncbi:transcription factor SPT20 homolog [Aedes albopictus]|uniref:Uncharacterized protein n=1 Tax=Aedes albopictus TaxID=7160 RepID=A0ABM1YM11_AEDAL